jgi:3-hydroxyacyl-[acyl-carrier-protein] dehydratase
MEFHQHRFDDVQGYLHHRPPYLMIDKIVSLNPDQIVTEKRITGEEFFLQGHFPGAPVFPGAMMQEVTTQSAGILIAANYNPLAEYDTADPEFNDFALGVLVKVTQARFRHFARPGQTLQCRARLEDHVGQFFDFSAAILCHGNEIMRNKFRLTNIPSSQLRGA